MHTFYLLSLFLVLFCISTTTTLCLAENSSSKINRVSVEGRLEIPVAPGRQQQSLSNIKVSMNGAEYITYTRYDGSFTFYGVPDGIYSLDVLSVDIFFPSAKLKITSTHNSDHSSGSVFEPNINVVEYKYPGSPRIASTYPILLRAIAPLGYFQPKPTFSLLGMLMANPMMVIMLVVGGGVVFMMSNIDPEVMKELKEQQKANGQDDPMAAIQKMTGGLFGGAKNDEDDE
jgi:hypothetical protein